MTEPSKRTLGLSQINEQVKADSATALAAHGALDAAFREHKRLTPGEDAAELAKHPMPSFLPTFDTAIELADRGEDTWRVTTGGAALYDIPFHGARNTHVTVIGNLGGLVNADASTERDSLATIVDEVRSAKSGLNLGLNAWYLLSSAQSNASWVPYFSIVGKLNRVPAREGDEDINFAQGLVSAGVSSGHGYAGEGRPHPVGLSAGVTYSTFSRYQHKQVFGVDRDHRWDGHATLVLPVREGAAVILDTNFTKRAGSAWRAGFALTRGPSDAPSGKKASDAPSGDTYTEDVR